MDTNDGILFLFLPCPRLLLVLSLKYVIVQMLCNVSIVKHCRNRCEDLSITSSFLPIYF